MVAVLGPLVNALANVLSSAPAIAVALVASAHYAHTKVRARTCKNSMGWPGLLLWSWPLPRFAIVASVQTTQACSTE